MSQDNTAASPLVSVIIPCYKQAKFLATSIESSLNQAGANVQVIVVNDGSPDDTVEIARRFGGRIIFIDQPNFGVGAARNAGFAKATGEYVIFLDSDDYLLPAFAATHLTAMQQQNASVSCSGWRQVDVENRELRVFDPPVFEPDAFHALLPINLCPPLCYMFKRSAIAAIDAFDPDRKKSGHEDWDLCLRLAASGAKFTTVGQVLASYRIHPASATNRYASMYDSGLAVLAKTRDSHVRCPSCGNRFAESYALFNDQYMQYYLRPAIVSGVFSRKNRPVWKHFVTRSMTHPALAVTMAWRLLTAAGRRISGRGPTSLVTQNSAGSVIAD